MNFQLDSHGGRRPGHLSGGVPFRDALLYVCNGDSGPMMAWRAVAQGENRRKKNKASGTITVSPNSVMTRSLTQYATTVSALDDSWSMESGGWTPFVL
jgi:hypothetical protein